VGRPLWIERFGIAKSVEHGHDLNHVKLNSSNGFEISCHEFCRFPLKAGLFPLKLDSPANSRTRHGQDVT